MDSERYATLLGKVIANLQSLEFVLRAYLHEHVDRREIRLPPGFDLGSAGVGAEVVESSLTDYSSLGEVMRRYNQVISDPDLRVALDLVDPRDALAHGRVSANSPASHFVLLKFDKSQRGKTRITLSQELSEEWLSIQVARVGSELSKVASLLQP